jgi:hypothetical protein
MSRLTGSDALGLYEAYQAVYDPQELTEEQVWEEVETWVNSLIEEGYDLSDYTWEEMYESYIEEASDLNMGLGRKVLADREAARATKPAPTPTSRPQPQLKGLSIGAGGFNVKNKPVNTGISPIFQRSGTKPVATPATTKPTATPAKPTPTATRPAAGAPSAPRPAATTPAASRPTATAAPKPAAAPAATTPAAKPSAMDQFAKANPKLAASAAERDRTRGTSATTNPLMKDMKSRLPAPKTPSPTTAKTGFDLAKKGVNLAASFDMFDVVKGYLIGEGYADTEEAALAIMTNMSEEWKQSIIEERAPGVKPYTPNRLNPLPKEKPLSGKKGDGSGYGADEKFKKPDDKIEKPGTEVPAPKKGGYGRIFSNIPYGIGAHANRNRSRNSTIRGMDPGAPRSEKLAPTEKKKPSKEIVRKRKDTNESYNIILSYLLDEGYANSVEAAESIMVSMSEDWVLSIIQ